jgi:hypothetical protein
MTREQHTPGPWSYGGKSETWYRVEAPPPADREWAADHVCNAFSEADAVLIAAAPELLDALDRLTGEVAACWGMDEVALRHELGNTNYSVVADRIEAARTAIAKATVPHPPDQRGEGQ